MHKSNIAAFVLVAVCFGHLCGRQIDAGNEEESSPDNADVTIEDVEIQTHESKNLESLNISAPIDAETSGKDGATDKSADDQSTFSFLTTTLAPLTSFLFGYPSPGDRENINNAENAGDAVTVAGFLKNDLPEDVQRQESLAEDTGNKDDVESLIRSLVQDHADSSPPESSSPADNTSSEREALPSDLHPVVKDFEKASAGQDNTSSTITKHEFSPADNSGGVPSTKQKTGKITQDSPGFAKRKLWMPLSKLGKTGKKHEHGTKPLLSNDVLLGNEKGLLSNVSELYASDSRQYPANGPNLGDLARYMKTCENCLTTEDGYQCPLHDSAVDLKNWMTELDSLITNGCQNKDDCGPGSRKCCHSKNPALERALREMTAMVRDMYNIFLDTCSNCPRNGGWTSWWDWSSCSASCGPGRRTRSRECNNPTPKGGGKDCPGEMMSTEPCKGPDCCTDGNWSPWSAWGDCSATCGSGMTVRSRTCSSPPPNDCGRTCPGPDKDMKPCEAGRSCCTPRDGNWASWTPWSACSVTCGGGGSRERSRVCSDPSPNECGQPCRGSSREMQTCGEEDCCVEGNWSQWLPWGSCSATCDAGVRLRMRRCDNPSPNFCGMRCPGSSSESQQCPGNVPCCVDGNWGPWAPWSQPSETCGSGMRERRRRCDNPSRNYCGAQCPGLDRQTDVVNTGVPCPPICEPQNGNWSPWARWSPCSTSCGAGVRDRSRTCSNPPPNECGSQCPGSPRETGVCLERECCVDGNWGSWERWGQPSVTCGTGSRSRRRRCDNPMPNYCGQPCPGDITQSQTYDTGIICCVDGNWGSWFGWSRPTVSCGLGTRERRRPCNNPSPNYCGSPCPGSEVDMQQTDTGVPCTPVCTAVNGNWSTWSPWSPCSVTCGSGVRDRSRSCSNPAPNECGDPCPEGLSRETQRCDEGSCCVNGNWSPWTPWYDCSVTCGVGVKKRERSCDNPPANDCGLPCPGSDQDMDRCNPGECCVNGSWSPWAPWSRPSVTCGTGTRERLRRCDNPSPNFCGSRCPGSGVDTESVNTNVPCFMCVDGNWASWTSWSACSATCGPGGQKRSRSCSNPPPNSCGQSCRGPAEDTKSCNLGDCCVDSNWGPWAPWSQPSETCGSGMRERRRRCDNPSRNYCGAQCPGLDRQTDVVNTGVPCAPICEPQNGNWSPWAWWSPCSTSCGAGVRDRSRTCSNPPPNECGASCPGSARETGVCLERECCVNGNWGQWLSWSQPSVTCGVGTRERRRRCDNPGPNYCGSPCSGPAEESQIYDTEYDCCVNGNWGQWLSWSQPSVTCGVGTRDRRRRCDNPGPNYCGSPCPGPAEESQNYDTENDCCVNGNWSPWAPWSQPSVTCGVGTRERRRRCDNPGPNYCGKQCPGSGTETAVFNTNMLCLACVDGDWGLWGSWSPCGVTCGMSQRERRRYCDSPPPNFCGNRCPGVGTESQAYRCGPDAIDGQWGVWGSWGECSVSCGRGQELRRRVCNSPPASVCGQPCPGPESDSRPCDNPCPCAERQWSSWGTWSRCDVTCGAGTRSRQRNCQSRASYWQEDCPGTCPGQATDVASCPGLPACEGPWGEWSPCSVTCAGFGSRQRRRQGPPSSFFDLTGTQVEEEVCQVYSPCPEWGPWGPCSATCEGVGMRERRLLGTVATSGDIIGRQYEVEQCTVNRPPCPAWGPWGPCSATCAGEGLRERRLLGTVSTAGDLVGRQLEVQDCTTYSPPCPPVASWGSWEDWCPCDCKRGIISRRRVCEELDEAGRPRPADFIRCGAGDARETQFCDIREHCPVCVSDCKDRSEGNYSSCSSCRDYLHCTSGQPQVFTCKNNYEWDAFIRKCVVPPSPSCALVSCVTSCDNREDGRYPSCFGCASYLECQRGRELEMRCFGGEEFNALTQRCEPGRSPTCVRTFPEDVDFQRDAPADSYFTTSELDTDKQRQLYLELSKEAGVAALYNRSDDDVIKEWDLYHNVTLSKTTVPAPKSKAGGSHGDGDDTAVAANHVATEGKAKVTTKEPTGISKHNKGQRVVKDLESTKDKFICLSDCKHAKEGFYQSCKSCQHYVECRPGNVARHHRCAKNRVWDDKAKKCKRASSTCHPDTLSSFIAAHSNNNV